MERLITKQQERLKYKMIIAVEGTKGFTDYEIFMRAMGVALSTPTVDSEIQVWSLGPHKINNFLYGTNLKIFSPTVLPGKINPCVILRAGSYNSEIKKQILDINPKTFIM